MRLLFAALFVLLVSPASAQTVEATYDMSAVGWGLIEVPQSIETDGDPTTREWLIRSLSTLKYMAVAIRPGRVCVSEWFSGGEPGAFLTQTTVQTVGGVTKLVTRDWHDRVTVTSVDTPECK